MRKFYEFIIFHKKKIILLLLFIVLVAVLFFISLINNNQEAITKEVVSLENETLENEPKEEENKEVIEEIKKIKVDIKGAVLTPGVYELDENSRVIDAINLSGGFLSNAYTRYLNLSKKLKDENVIIVNTYDEIYEIKIGDNTKEVCEKTNDACITKDDAITNDINDRKTNEEEKTELNKSVNINEASKEELQTIPGIGESKANSIIEYRDNNGLFDNIKDIQNVSGIGNKLYESIKEYITV